MDNINDIISSLSDDDIKKLKDVASSILGNDEEKEDNSSNPLSSLNLNQNDVGTILKVKSILDKMNKTPSKNADLILALKPHLTNEKKEKADKAVKILKLLDILPYIKDLF